MSLRDVGPVILFYNFMARAGSKPFSEFQMSFLKAGLTGRKAVKILETHTFLKNSFDHAGHAHQFG